MISLVENEKDKQRLLRICGKTAFGCKIASIVMAYGLDKSFACFWLDSEDNVAYCMVDGLMLLTGTILREKETREFLRAVGARSVMCAVRNAEALQLTAESSGDVLKKELPALAGKPASIDDASQVNIRELYTLLEETGMVEEFEPFYLDLSHKLRHHTALAVMEYRSGELCGCALVSSISNKAALLSAVAVREPYRRQGIGSALVRAIEARLPGKTMYVLREKDKHKAFYRSLGYTKADTWVFSSLK